jgi:hypothetical protein
MPKLAHMRLFRNIEAGGVTDKPDRVIREEAPSLRASKPQGEEHLRLLGLVHDLNPTTAERSDFNQPVQVLARYDFFVRKRNKET